ncbi:cytochrome c [Geoalkalibacter halelectricus]|uniref:Cytochrome c n=1 Tax=Geoalkalibacter halelectricus TaxID=2847045 RepID=A0ABY5ZNM7_9BACT|nr:cytochrome c [Geoalkalibacter halelectricus]MDO3377484.1 cytochrome c [Geoalkalibacter halelectricus]UWZ80757.1 cytochrome c [Geoalkalibacter halelectricus]
MKSKARDIILVAIGVAIVAFLLAAPPSTTAPVPYDDTHRQYYNMARDEGKKAAERFCADCHNQDMMPLPEGHPPTYRCLFCHRLERGK